jgi:hypothetical protein
MAHPMGSSFKNWQIDAELWRRWAERETREAERKQQGYEDKK